MTSSAGVRRGERFDREQIAVDTEHRRVVVDLLADSGSPDVTGTDQPLPALGRTLRTVPGPASRGVRDLPDADLPHIGGSDGAPEPVGAVPLELRPDGPLAPLTVGVLDSAMGPDPALGGSCVTGRPVRAQAPSRPVPGHATVVAGRVPRRTPGAVLDAQREDGRVAQEERATARRALGRIAPRRHGDGHDVHADRP
ncbi:hypothetical protein ACI79G_20310 [Geodermatophilus sp. SYSU D00779]